MGTIERFATTNVDPVHRLDYWNRIVGETFLGLKVDSDRQTFKAEMLRWRLGDLTMIRPRSAEAVVHRWRDDHPSRQDRLMLHFQHSGHSRQFQRGLEADLGAGDFVLADGNEYYRLDISPANDVLVVEMARSAIAERLPEIDDIMARRISGASPSGRLLHNFILSLWQQGDQAQTDDAWKDGVANIFLDLLALAVRGAAATPASIAGSGVVERLTALIETQLGDPELKTSALADELRISMRSVQLAFAAIGTTPSAYILERRLLRAADRLVADRNLSITATAFDLGFNDSAYFTRCFRHRFGVSPKAYRTTH